VPASKRRRAAAAKRVAAVPAVSPAEVETPRPATPERAVPARAAPARGRSNPDPDSEPRWSQLGLLVLLALTFALQLPIGALIHATSHTNLLIVDLVFFQPQYVLIACFLMMPVARILTKQPRALRLLESLSLGAVYALLALLLSTVFVHPASGSISSAQFIKQLQFSDGLRIGFSDLLAVFATVAFFPGINRMLGAPGRRARQRMIARGAPGTRPDAPRGARAKSTPRPKRPR
jgi:hypothetical protein